VTLVNVTDATRWVYALAANSGAWSSGLKRVRCVLHDRASPDKPAVRMDVYKNTPSSVTLTWNSIVCETLVVQSYQLQYSPTKHITGLYQLVPHYLLVACLSYMGQ